ncbi:MAG: hypothetical protein JST75_21565 [Bacteroidetes bacterium]|nr:hypothetical protein [Bacteroidota bacterium]
MRFPKLFPIKLMIVFSSSALLLLFSYTDAIAQIGGSTCVNAGQQVQYSFSGRDNSSTNFSWTVSGGTIVSGGSGQGFTHRSVTVQWNSNGTSGSVTLNASPLTNTNPPGPSSYSGSITVNVSAPFAAGNITSNATQTIPYNTIPANVTSAVATGGYCLAPAYTYQWQIFDGTTYVAISGQTTNTLVFPSPLTQTTTVRKMVTETHSGSVIYSSVATINVLPQLIGGTISGSTTINYNTVPPAFTNTASASGGSCADVDKKYIWQKSTDNVNFTDMSAYTGLTYSPPALTTTTYYRRKVTCLPSEIAYSNTLTITVNPAVYPGTIAQVSLNIATNTDPGALVADPASGGACSGSYLYQWQSSATNTTYADITGATSLYYDPGNLASTMYYRRKVTCGTDVEYSNVCQVLVNTPLSYLNYIRVRDITIPGITTSTAAAALTNPTDVKQTTQYFDGLGRMNQSVSRQASPLLKDIVAVNEYDLASREIVKYLPYVSTTNDGNNKSYPVSDLVTFNGTQFSGENYYMSYAIPENSPLNRILTSYAPGLNWVGLTRGVSSASMVNDVSEGVRIWTIASAAGSLPTSTAAYGSGLLFKNITTNEQGQQVIEYKDMEGHVILKKVQVAASPGVDHTGWLCTYYVYDDLNNLRFVMQPRAIELISASSWTLTQAIADELCFRYEYDARRNMIIKKIPGAAELWMVYDDIDRLVMTQDANARSQSRWNYTQYDNLDRAMATGQIVDSHDRVYHSGLSANSNAYPNLGLYTYELFTHTLFDDYTWVSAYPDPFTVNRSTSYDASFLTPSNTVFPYPQALTQSSFTRGLVTGMRVEIPGTGQMLYVINYYDDRGRIIQTQKTNNTGGNDISTQQYDFTGKVLRSHLKQEKQGTNAQTHFVLAKMNYDAAGRLLTLYKNIDNAATDQLLSTNTYNELGQLQNKQLGNNIENLAYEYNIRGWLTEINKNYVAGTTSTNYFGMELGYDKGIAGVAGVQVPQFNGNIQGQVWRSSGDGVIRKYNYKYDLVNRITRAEYSQNNSGTWGATPMDFSVWGFDSDNGYGMKYDANGNILMMIQGGWKAGASTIVDALRYTYTTNSNKLLQVTDDYNDVNSKLGDFHYNPATKTSTDYTYDGNGNLTIDNNKGVTATTYNYLNLPVQVSFGTKGSISYVYDASGNKLSKTVTDNSIGGKTITTITNYIAGFVYSTKTTSPADPVNDYTTRLDFVAHEEGRARWAYHKYLNGTTAYGFEYDYFLKDHLGNTRVVITQQKDTTQYLATMEAAYRSTETQLFNNITNTSYKRTLVSGYPNDLSVTNPNDSVAKVNGSGQKTGPAILLKVMSGDKIDIAVQSYYNTGTNTTQNPSVTDVLNSLANGIVTMAGGAKGSAADLNNTGASPVYAALNSFLTGNDPNTGSTKPKAYLNWILLDEQLNYVSSYPQSGAVPVGTAAALNTLGYTGLPITKSGYLYIWVSNETAGWDVFFDNLSVKQYTGPLLEETHYYPFGLTMSGISSKALKPNYAENKFKFQKQELQSKEFSDGSGLEMYEFKYRFDDPQIGRFWQIDPLADKYVYNSTYAFAENKVITFVELEGLEGIKYDEVDKDGKKRTVVEKNIVVLLEETKSTNSEAKNKRIERRNENKLAIYQAELNEYYNGGDGKGSTGSNGNLVYFKFNVKRLPMSDTRGTDQNEITSIGRAFGVKSSEKWKDGSNKLATAAVVTTGNTSGDHGDSDGIRIRLDFKPGSLSHEVGHTFKLPDDYANGGVMGSPPNHVNPDEVDQIVKKSYEK